MRAIGFDETAVGLDLLAQLPFRCLLAEPVRDDAQVTERARKVPFLDRPVEVSRFPAAHDVHEILHVAILALELFHHLSVRVHSARRRIARDDHAAAFAVDDVADVHAAVLVHVRRAAALVRRRVAAHGRSARLRRETAHLENERRRLVVVNHDLRVRRVRIILVAEAGRRCSAWTAAGLRRGTSVRHPSGGCPGCRRRRCRKG